MAGRLPVYMRATCKTGVVAARNGSTAHLPDQLRTAFLPGGKTSFSVDYLCGNVTHDAVVLASAEQAAAMCAVCVDTAKGPCVYRCFNSGKGLIYIGSAKARLKRLMSHASESPWWPEVADVTAEHYPTLFEARVAERLAIEAERPLHNKQYNRGRRSA